jgi:hypothetical protein
LIGSHNNFSGFASLQNFFLGAFESELRRSPYGAQLASPDHINHFRCEQILALHHSMRLTNRCFLMLDLAREIRALRRQPAWASDAHADQSPGSEAHRPERLRRTARIPIRTALPDYRKQSLDLLAGAHTHITRERSLSFHVP